MDIHPKYITDESGKNVAVALPIAEYEALMEHLEDLEDLAEAREALDKLQQGTEQPIPWDAIKGEYGL